MRNLFILFLLLINFSQIHAEELIIDLSHDVIEIDSKFAGKTISLFGIKGGEGEVVIVLRGPKHDYLVKKKARKYGMWLNVDSTVLHDVESYFLYNPELNRLEVLNQRYMEYLNLTHPFGEIISDEYSDTRDARQLEFEQALYQRFVQNELFNKDNISMKIVSDRLFRAEILFPKNILTGTYLAESYYLEDGKLKSFAIAPIDVYQVGFDAFVYNSAMNYPTLYGIFGVIMALFVGWIGGIFFRKI